MNKQLLERNYRENSKSCNNCQRCQHSFRKSNKIIICQNTFGSKRVSASKICDEFKEKPTKFKARDGLKYQVDTVITDCKECMNWIKHKCNWEMMTRLAIIWGYYKHLCKDCKKKINLKELS